MSLQASQIRAFGIPTCTDCDLVTITQHMQLDRRHTAVERWVRPEEFVDLAGAFTARNFAGVMSGPPVRSSYRAGRLYTRVVSTGMRRPERVEQ